MNFSEFVRIVEEFETPERREAREAEEAYSQGRISLYQYIKAQLPGFRKVIDGVEYLSSFDNGPMVKKMYPIEGSKGTAISQKELYSPATLERYTKFLKRNPGKDTEALAVVGEPDNYKIYDGHHRHQAYRNAKRTHVPVWVPMQPS
jgi:hypothetical protein